MALPATDAFSTALTQALTAYSANWTDPDSVFFAQDPADVAYSTAGDYRMAYWSADTFNNNQYAQVVVVDRGGGYMGVGVRLSGVAGSEYGYYLYWNNTTCYFEKSVNGTITEFSSVAAPGVGVVVRLEVDGTTVTPLFDGSTSGAPSAVTDSAIASGAAGLAAVFATSATTVDDWEGGNLSSTANLTAQDGLAGTPFGDQPTEIGAGPDFGNTYTWTEVTGGDALDTPGLVGGTSNRFNHSFDTEVNHPNPFGPTLSGDTFTIPYTGQWWVTYVTRWEDDGGSNRTELNTLLVENGTELKGGWSSGFIRRSGGADDCIMSGAGLLNITAGQSFQLRTYNLQGPNGDGATRGTNRSAGWTHISFTYLGDNVLDWIRVDASAGGQSMSQATWSQLTDLNNTVDSNGSTFALSGGALQWTGASGDLALVAGSIGNTRAENSTRFNPHGRLALAGTGYPRVTTYSRGDQNGEDLRNGVMAMAAIMEKTSAAVQNITLEFQDPQTVAVTPTVRAEATGLHAISLPSDAQVAISLSGSSGNINATAPTAVTIGAPGTIDTDAFTAQTSSVDVDNANTDVLVLGTFYTDDAITRAVAAAQIRINGTASNYGAGARYNRNQASQALENGSMFGGAAHNLAANDSIQIYGQALAATGTQNLDEFSLFILRLDSLTEPGGGSTPLTSQDGLAGTPFGDQATLGQTRVLTAQDGQAGTPGADTPSIGQTHVLAAQDGLAGTPFGDQPTLGQTHALTAQDGSVGPAVGDVPSIGQTHVLTAQDGLSGTPGADTPGIGQTHALAAQDGLAGTPFGDQPSASASRDLTAQDGLAGTPFGDQATLGQTHILLSQDGLAGTPAADTPNIGQTHALTAQDGAVGPAVGDAPSISQTHVLTAQDGLAGTPFADPPNASGFTGLTAQDGLAGTPFADQPTLGQTHALTAQNGLAGQPFGDQPALTPVAALTAQDGLAGAPGADTPSIGQTHVLTAQDGTTGQPFGDQPSASGFVGLTAQDGLAGTPFGDQPTLGQTHVLTAQDGQAGTPAADTPSIGQTHALVAQDGTVGPAVGDQPTLGQTHILLSQDGLAGTPFGDQSDLLTGTVLLSQDGLAGTPIGDNPSLGQTHILIIGDALTGVPIADAPSVGQVHALVAQDGLAGQPFGNGLGWVEGQPEKRLVMRKPRTFVMRRTTLLNGQSRKFINRG